VIDTWGWSDGNYADGQFKLLLQGHLKEGWKKDYDLEQFKDSKFYRSEPNFGDKVQAVIFVVAANEVSNQDGIDNDYYVRLNKFRQDATDLGLIPIVLISKADKLDPELRADFKQVFTSETLYKDVLDTLRDYSSFNYNTLYPAMLYSTDKQRVAHIEVAALQAFAAAVRAGQIYINKYIDTQKKEFLRQKPVEVKSPLQSLLEKEMEEADRQYKEQLRLALGQEEEEDEDHSRKGRKGTSTKTKAKRRTVRADDEDDEDDEDEDEEGKKKIQGEISNDEKR